MVPFGGYGTSAPVVNAGVAAGSEPEGEADRPLRADARRNRTRILEAADEVFATLGAGAPIDEIARRAGLGIGTLYRHFPTKETLWEAVAEGRFERIIADIRSRAAAPDPGGAFFEVLERVVEEGCAKRDLGDALLGAGIDMTARHREAIEALRSAVEVLLRRAQEAGAVRRDVGVEELFALVGGTCSAGDRGFGEADPRRLAAVVCDGLRARA